MFPPERAGRFRRTTRAPVVGEAPDHGRTCQPITHIAKPEAGAPERAKGWRRSGSPSAECSSREGLTSALQTSRQARC